MKIVICGNYGAKNKGDEMILSGMIAMLKDISPQVGITVLSATPSETEAHHQVKALPQFAAGFRSIFSNRKATHKAVKECDFFILGGGGLFGSLTFRANLIWGIQAWQAYRHQKPVLMLGQSIGELKGFWRKFITKKIFSKAKYISLRDSESIKRLENLGIKKCTLAPDYALYRKNPQSYTTPQNHNTTQIKTVAFALRANAKLDSRITEITTWFKEQGWKISYINFKEPYDRELHREVDISADFITVEEMKNQDLIIGMRLHSIITAIKYKTPFLAINYAPKVKALIKDLDLTSQILDFKNFEQQVKNAHKIKNKLSKINIEIAEQHKKAAMKLSRLIN